MPNGATKSEAAKMVDLEPLAKLSVWAIAAALAFVVKELVDENRALRKQQ